VYVLINFGNLKILIKYEVCQFHSCYIQISDDFIPSNEYDYNKDILYLVYIVS